jgi:hypothetical protein
MPDVPDSKIGYSNTASCIKIGNMIISFMNGIPEVVDRVRVGVEVRAVGQEYTYWLALMLILTDGSVRTERRQIKEIPGVVIFPLDFLSVEAKRHNLMVDVDIVDATNVHAGPCS